MLELDTIEFKKMTNSLSILPGMGLLSELEELSLLKVKYGKKYNPSCWKRKRKSYRYN